MAQQHINYSSPNDGLGDTLRDSQVKSESNFNELYNNKVDKVVGKGLSDTNFTQAEKDKLAALDSGDIVQSDWDEGNSLSPAFIKNKPVNNSEFFNDSNYVPDVVSVGNYVRTAGSWTLVDSNALEPRVAVNDVDYTITGINSQLIAYTAITADRTVTLPLAPVANQRIWITDESGLCSNVRRIIVNPNGKTIGGDSFTVINFPNGSGYLIYDGVGKWNIVSTTSVQLSAGVQSMPTVTDNGNGSVTIGTGVYSLFANVGGQGRPKAYQIAGGTFTFTNNSTNFIYADYNTTTGVVSLQQTTSESALNDLTQVLIYAAYRQGTTLHARNFDTWGLALVNKLNRSIYRTQRVRFEEGGVLIGESATPTVRTATISAGTVWVAAAENPLTALTSAANTCYHVIQTAPGVWNTTTVVTQYNNTQYNTTAGLQTLTNNNYAVNWIYRSVGTDNDMAIVLGGGDYNLGQAQSSSKPTNLPTFLRHMELVGRIIVQKNANTSTQIDNVSSTFFTASGVTDHEALSNLQGGAANDHQHLSSAQIQRINSPKTDVTSIYNKNYFTNTSDFTSTGVTPTIVNNSVQMTGGAGTFAQYLTVNNTVNTDENYDYKVIVKAVTTTATSYGIAIGRRSVNTWYDASIALQVSFGQNTLVFYDPTTSTIIKTVNVNVIVTNDVLELRLVQKGTELVGVLKNLTQQKTDTIRIENNLGATKNFKAPNTGNFTIWNLGGTAQINSINIQTNNPFGADVICVGDSKTFGYSSTSKALRFSSLLNKLGTVMTYGGDGDRTVEIVQSINYIIALKPKYVVLCIGRNDLASAVSTGTWQANYQSIVNSLTSAGIIVIHLYGIDETVQNQSTLWSFINTTYSTNKIDVSGSWVNGTMLSSDNVHPNELGHRYVSNSILSSGLIPNVNNRIENLMEFIPANQSSSSTSVNTANYIPYSDGSAFLDSDFYRAGAGRYAIGTISPYNYGSTFNSFELLGTAFGLFSVGRIGQTTKFYFSGDHQFAYFGANVNGIINEAANITPNGQFYFGAGGTSASVSPSAQVQINSTTRGFLPPRMTNAQRLAITSPAIGLMVYCTDATEGVYVYKASGWQAPSVGYKSYTSLVSQTGTSAPTEIVLDNNTGATATWSYVSTGFYRLTFSSAILTSDKTIVFTTKNNSGGFGVTFTGNRASSTEIEVITSNTGLLDSQLTKASLEIRIYN